jgi:hypothetical protein
VRGDFGKKRHGITESSEKFGDVFAQAQSTSTDTIMLSVDNLEVLICAAMEAIKRSNSARYQRTYTRRDERAIRRILKQVPAEHQIWRTLEIDKA